QTLLEVGQRKRHVAGDIDSSHTVLRTLPDVERDVELAVALVPRMWRHGVTVALGSQQFLNPVRCVLEHVFVRRAFPRTRHQIFTTAVWERIADEDDGDMGAWPNRHREVGGSIVVDKLHGVRDADGKVPAAPAVFEIAIDSRVQGFALEWLAARQMQRVEEL